MESVQYNWGFKMTMLMENNPHEVSTISADQRTILYDLKACLNIFINFYLFINDMFAYN